MGNDSFFITSIVHIKCVGNSLYVMLILPLIGFWSQCLLWSYVSCFLCHILIDIVMFVILPFLFFSFFFIILVSLVCILFTLYWAIVQILCYYYHTQSLEIFFSLSILTHYAFHLLQQHSKKIDHSQSICSKWLVFLPALTEQYLILHELFMTNKKNKVN